MFYLLVFCIVCWSFQRYCYLCCSLCQMWSQITYFVFRDDILSISINWMFWKAQTLSCSLFFSHCKYIYFLMRSVVICKSKWRETWSLTNFLSIDWMLDLSVRDVCDLWPRGHWQSVCNVGCSFLHQAPEIAAKLSSFRAPPGMEEVRFYFPHYLIWRYKYGQGCDVIMGPVAIHVFYLVIAVALHSPSLKCKN